MKNLVHAWRASLETLRPQNLTPLLLVTLKTTAEVYWLVVKYFWWFLVSGIALLFMMPHYLAYLAWIIIWLAILIEASRPSLLNKNFWYFVQKAPSCLPLAVLFVTYCCISSLVLYSIVPYFIFMMFFICDANYVLRDIARAPWRAAKLSLMVAPLYLILAGLLYLNGKLFCCAAALSTLWTLFVVLPLFIVLMSRLYVVWIHKEYKEFYERCW